MDLAKQIRCMEAFVTVAETGSFSACAQRMGMSQPSISRLISELEDELGIRLLQRTTRRLTITEAGRLYLNRAHGVLAGIQDAHNALTPYTDDVSGVIRVGAPLLWAELKVAPYLSEFLSLYPNVCIDLVATDTKQDIVEDNLDMVLRVGKMRDSSYIASVLAQTELILCATPAYLAKTSVPKIPADLLQHSCLVYGGLNDWGFSDRTQAKSSRPEYVSVKGACTSTSISVLLSALQQNLGLLLVPDILVKSLTDSGSLVRLLPQYRAQVRNLPVEHVFVMYANRKNLPAKTRLFIDFLKKKFKPDVHLPVLPKA